jgi:hypothetical protein
MHGLGQPGLGESVDREVLHIHRLVLADDLRGQLMVELTPLVPDLTVKSGDLNDGRRSTTAIPQ